MGNSNYYTLYWQDGKTQMVKGLTIDDAIINAKIPASVLHQLFTFEQMEPRDHPDSRSYVWVGRPMGWRSKAMIAIQEHLLAKQVLRS